jgi:hypothetical protein
MPHSQNEWLNEMMHYNTIGLRSINITDPIVAEDKVVIEFFIKNGE